ncbi:CxxC-x17-CxxC domain-containing protein [Thermoproteota archaeon]
MTKVTCSECGERCEVPFKPTSTKPVYCSDCFEKKEKGSGRSSGRDRGHSSKDLDIINKKLDKIMEALDID